jgi:hypothetical protein
MKMMRVQFGPNDGCFVAVLVVADGCDSEEYIISRAAEAVKSKMCMSDEDLEESVPVTVQDVTDNVVVYTITE